MPGFLGYYRRDEFIPNIRSLSFRCFKTCQRFEVLPYAIDGKTVKDVWKHGSFIREATKKHLVGWVISGIIPSYIGIIISHYKDPY